MSKPKQKPQPKTCKLCDAAGLPTLAKMQGTSKICEDHHVILRTTGRAWCPRCERVVPRTMWIAPYCQSCNRARFAKPPKAPAGYITMTALSARIYVSPSTLRRWLRRGWPVAHLVTGHVCYVADLPAYPPGPADTRAGRRRRAELDQCKQCGTAIDNPGSHRRYCPDCRKARRAEVARVVARATGRRVTRRAA